MSTLNDEERQRRALLDEELVLRYVSGDNDAFGELYETHYQQVFLTIRRKVYDFQDAEDLTTIIFMKIKRNLDKFDSDRGRFWTWVSVIINNACIDYFRSLKRRSRVSYHDPDDTVMRLGPGTTEPDQGEGDRWKILYDAIGDLAERQRIIVEMNAIQGFTLRKIAEMLDVPIGTVKARLRRGKRNLQQLLLGRGYRP